MRYVCIFFTLIIFLLITPWFSGAHAQPVEHALTQLRGTWEYHTFYKKWKLTFLSDEDLIRNSEDVKYSLTPGAINIIDNGTTETLTYILEGKKLTLTDPSGATMTYDYQRPGETEQTIDGVFFSETDSTQSSLIVFKSGTTVSLHNGFDEERTGLYREKNNSIIMVFDDGAAETAVIRFRDTDGRPDGIIMNGELFSKDQPIAEVPAEHYPFIPPLPAPWPRPFPDPCPHPVPDPRPIPQPEPYPAQPSSSQNIDPPPNPVQHGGRTIGDTRRTNTSGDNNTPVRSGERRP